MKEINLKYDLEHRSFPAQVIIETCTICNLKCRYCPYSILQRQKGIMSEQVFHKIVDEIAEVDSNTSIWPILLGESLILGDHIFSLIDYAKDRQLRVCLNTNGTLIHQNLDNLMARRLDQIIIGIDASKKETYQKIRVGGDFDCVVQNVNTLLAQKPETLMVVVQFVESEINTHEEEDFKDYWLGQGAVVKIRRELGWGSAFSSRLDKQNAKRIPCPWMARTMTVHWNGNVVQCDGDYEGKYAVGNVSDSTLYELWNGPLRERRERHLNNDFDFGTCRYCSDWACGISEWYYPNGEDKMLGGQKIDFAIMKNNKTLNRHGENYG